MQKIKILSSTLKLGGVAAPYSPTFSAAYASI